MFKVVIFHLSSRAVKTTGNHGDGLTVTADLMDTPLSGIITILILTFTHNLTMHTAMIPIITMVTFTVPQVVIQGLEGDRTSHGIETVDPILAVTAPNHPNVNILLGVSFLKETNPLQNINIFLVINQPPSTNFLKASLLLETSPLQSYKIFLLIKLLLKMKHRSEISPLLAINVSPVIRCLRRISLYPQVNPLARINLHPPDKLQRTNTLLKTKFPPEICALVGVNQLGQLANQAGANNTKSTENYCNIYYSNNNKVCGVLRLYTYVLLKLKMK